MTIFMLKQNVRFWSLQMCDSLSLEDPSIGQQWQMSSFHTIDFYLQIMKKIHSFF